MFAQKGLPAREILGVKSNGNFMAFLDSDDAWNPGHLTSGIQILEKNPDIDVLFSNFQVMEKNTGLPA